MRFALFGIIALLGILPGCASPAPPTLAEPTLMLTPTPLAPARPDAVANLQNLIPKPHTVIPADGSFLANLNTRIIVPPNNPELDRIAQQLANTLLPVTQQLLQVSDDTPAKGDIVLSLTEDALVRDEGYLLSVTPAGIQIQAVKPAGLFYGTQTLRQLLPATIDRRGLETGVWEVAAVSIRDVPRFAYRGAMLDVARHFFTADDVKKYIDALAAYKLNHLHLHLTDDQGWRIEIKSWDKLATYGGSTRVGGGAGGYYTQDEYRDLVQYAADRYITVVPEIDMPGHTNAALAAYAELNCDGRAPALYTGTEVGFSSLCVDQELTYKFIEDVVRELVTLTPGPYLHIGGDEARATQAGDYVEFIERVESIVRAHGKQMMGWEEIAQAELDPTSVVQYWFSEQAREAVKQGAKVVFSPASLAYLDMKYDDTTRLGLDWAGEISTRKAYDWEPTTLLEGIREDSILGIEAPLWSETLETLDDIEYMAFPRLLGIAEIAWSQQTGRAWEEYAARLASHGARLHTMGINYYPLPEIEK